MKTCAVCGCIINEDNGDVTYLVNAGLESEFIQCKSCHESGLNRSKIISCEACGEYFSDSELHPEEIEGHTFTACPHCGKDIVEALTWEEFADEHFAVRYAVIVRFHDGARGYVVSVPASEGTSYAIKKLAEKIDLSGASDISCAAILLEEDEF